VALLTLGCAKNLVDSEEIASLLERGGAEVVHEPRGAAVAVVNTCGFIQAAKEEAIECILEVAGLKGPGGLRCLVVTGCLTERYGSELAVLLPEADAVLGIDPPGAAAFALRALGLPAEPLPSQAVLRTRRLTPRAWSYLRIAHGCDNRCAYCAIPLIRGPLRSLPHEDLVQEAHELAERGVKELNVIAQDTAGYGVDTTGAPRLHLLLRDLCAVDGLRWIRVLYAHPAHVYDELIETIAGQEKVCPYLDIPLQHVSDHVLQRMGRRISRAGIEDLIGGLRERIPGVVLRTTFMTGFPGETDEDFEELCQFVRDVRFDRLGCFAYSQEEGTAAAGLCDQVPDHVREERRDALMAIQQEIACEAAAARVGQRDTVLMEEGDGPEPHLRPARSAREAPDVDPLIFVKGDAAPPAGEFCDVRITGSAGYDCIAEVATEAPHGT
jgi:ribosomal protein S12 methylthiotransferase